MTPGDIHNRDAAHIVDEIIRPTLEAGGSFLSVLVLLESVITGVMLFGVKDGGDGPVLAMLMEHVKDRLTAIRAGKKAEMN